MDPKGIRFLLFSYYRYANMLKQLKSIELKQVFWFLVQILGHNSSFSHRNFALLIPRHC